MQHKHKKARRGGERNTRNKIPEAVTHRSPLGGIDESFRGDAGSAGEKQQHSAAATTTQADNVVFGQTSIRMPAVFDGSFKVGEDPQQNVLIFTSQMNACFGAITLPRGLILR